MDENTKYTLISAFLSKQANVDQMSDLREWLSESEINRLEFEELKEMWLNSNIIYKTENINTLYERVEGKISGNSQESKTIITESKPKRRYFHFTKWAAAAILILGVSWIINRSVERIEQEQLTVVHQIIKENAKGVKSHIKLPDGTNVWLNAASSISYPQGFTDAERLVSLEGEAYFEVVKDSTRPFRVTSGNVVTTALGTSFNIKANEDENIKVSLNSGKVNVTRMDNNEHVILKPGQQAILDGSVLSVEEFENEIVMAWKDGTIIFNNTSFDKMTSVLEKWYDVTFVIENLSSQERNNIKVVGEFENQTLDNVLKLLSHSMHFKYTINKKIVTLKF